MMSQIYDLLPWSQVLRSVGFFIAGAVLLYCAWRIRFRAMAEPHPRCAKCRFDLFMRWPEATRCPECGHQLTATGSVVYIANDRQLVFAPLAGLVGLTLLIGTFFHGRHWIRDTNWYEYKPTSWLIDDMVEVKDGWRSHLIGNELRSRLEDDEFVAANHKLLTKAIDRILEAPVEMPTRRTQAIQMFFWNASRQGLVSTPHLQRFLDQSFDIAFVDPSHNEMRTTPDLTDKPATLQFLLRATLVNLSEVHDFPNVDIVQVVINDQEIDRSAFHRKSGSVGGGSGGGGEVVSWQLIGVEATVLGLDEGDHAIAAEVCLSRWDHTAQQPRVLRRYRVQGWFTIESEEQFRAEVSPSVRDVMITPIEEDRDG